MLKPLATFISSDFAMTQSKGIFQRGELSEHTHAQLWKPWKNGVRGTSLGEGLGGLNTFSKAYGDKMSVRACISDRL